VFFSFFEGKVMKTYAKVTLLTTACLVSLAWVNPQLAMVSTGIVFVTFLGAGCYRALAADPVAQHNLNQAQFTARKLAIEAEAQKRALELVEQAAKDAATNQAVADALKAKIDGVIGASAKARVDQSYDDFRQSLDKLTQKEQPTARPEASRKGAQNSNRGNLFVSSAAATNFVMDEELIFPFIPDVMDAPDPDAFLFDEDADWAKQLNETLEEEAQFG
jgi:hypothetical protein